MPSKYDSRNTAHWFLTLYLNNLNTLSSNEFELVNFIVDLRRLECNRLKNAMFLTVQMNMKYKIEVGKVCYEFFIKIEINFK